MAVISAFGSEANVMAKPQTPNTSLPSARPMNVESSDV